MRTTLKIILPLIVSVATVSLFFAAYQVRTVLERMRAVREPVLNGAGVKSGSAGSVGGAGASARFSTPAVVVFPASSRVAKCPIDVDLDDVIARAVDEVHRQPDRMGPRPVQTARYGCENEVVLWPTACGRR